MIDVCSVFELVVVGYDVRLLSVVIMVLWISVGVVCLGLLMLKLIGLRLLEGVMFLNRVCSFLKG